MFKMPLLEMTRHEENFQYEFEGINLSKKNAVKLGDVQAAKPFLKWAGGKSQLLKEIRTYYPFSEEINKYAEPFVGGGAVLFDILNNYSLKQVYLSDINKDLILTYICIRDKIKNLLCCLKQQEEEYLVLDNNARKKYYMQMREIFNSKNSLSDCQRASLMIFLNKTCFNGLYRVNKKGEFNVPSGDYKNPLICNEENLKCVSQKLQNTEIVCGDYRNSFNFVDEKTFVYFDPPYRPLNKTANFTSYAANSFRDGEQIELADYIMQVHEKGAKFLLSNSDPKNQDINDVFFDKLYSRFKIIRTDASRMISCKRESRGKIKELFISNF